MENHLASLTSGCFVHQVGEEPTDCQAFLADGILVAGEILSCFNNVLPSQMPGGPNACLRAEATRYGEGGNRAACEGKPRASAVESSMLGAAHQHG